MKTGHIPNPYRVRCTEACCQNLVTGYAWCPDHAPQIKTLPGVRRRRWPEIALTVLSALALAGAVWLAAEVITAMQGANCVCAPGTVPR